MLQADMAMQMPLNPAHAIAVKLASRKRASVPQSRSHLKVTWSAIELDGSRLAADAYDVATSLMVEAFKLAKSNDRDELLIANFAPDVEVGSPQVAELQGKIEELVAEACARIGDDAPEMRLSLHGDEYDLRCYLGRSRPTDFRFDYDA